MTDPIIISAATGAGLAVGALPEREGPDEGEIRDVVIVGSGPAGYTAAVYTARANLAPVVLEGSVTAGGALMNTTEVENFPGFRDGIMGPELMDNMRAQAERFGATLVTDDAVSLDLHGEVKTITDGSGRVWRARAVILAMGSAYRELGLPNEKRLSGHGVSWCATCDGFFFRDQEIAVVGGGDSAVEEATFLTRFAKKVHLVHRRGELRASKIMAERAHADEKIEFQWNSQVTAIHGEDKVSGITLTDTETGQTRELPVTGLFVAIGHDPRNELLQVEGGEPLVELDAEGYVVAQGRSSRTNVEGVFACGDLVDHTYRQAITAAGSGCAAALDAERYLAFYGQSLPEAVTRATWARLIDPAVPMIGRLAESDGSAAGFSLSVLHEGSWTIAPVRPGRSAIARRSPASS